MKGKSSHVPSDPSDSSASLGSEQSRAFQEGNSEVEAGDVSPTFGKGQGMPPMATTDVNDATCRRKPEQVPQTCRFKLHTIGRSGQSPPLRVASLEVLAGPILHDDCSPPHIADQLRCAAGPQITSGGDRRGKAGPTASPNEREPRRTEQSASRAGQAAGSREG